MSFLGNLIWLIFGGLIVSIGWALAGVILCISVIGIPFGMQCFKIAGLTLMPFGRNVDIGEFGAFGFLGNVLWIMVFGWELFVAHFVAAFFLAITIIGLPFAKQHIKLAKLALVPFGARIYS